MKSIGFLIANMDGKGGTERVTSILANGLIERGYNVKIISCKDGLNPTYPLRREVKLFSLRDGNKKSTMGSKISSLYRLNRFLKEQKIDICIAVDVTLFLYLWILHFFNKKIKFIAWEHFNYYINNSKTTQLARLLAARYADCLVVLGKNDLKNYTNHFNNIKRIEYIYNPLTFDTTKSTTLNNKQIIAAGRLTKQKGFDLLLKIWKKIEDKHNGWQLKIIGEGKEKKNLLSQIVNNKIPDVILSGYSDNIQNEYLNSSLFILSSRYEGFVLVLLEAQAAGLPCVSFNCKEGPSEIIDNNVNGYLINNFNLEEMGRKISFLINNKKELEKFSKNAKKDLGRFEKQVILDRWEDLFQSL